MDQVLMHFFNYCKSRDAGRERVKLKDYWQRVKAEWASLSADEKLLHEQVPNAWSCL